MQKSIRGKIPESIEGTHILGVTPMEFVPLVLILKASANWGLYIIHKKPQFEIELKDVTDE